MAIGIWSKLATLAFGMVLGSHAAALQMRRPARHADPVRELPLIEPRLFKLHERAFRRVHPSND